MAYDGEAMRADEPARTDGPSAQTLAYLDGWNGHGLDVSYDVDAKTITSWLNHEDRPAMTPRVMASHHELLGGLQRVSWAGDDWFRFYVNRARSEKVYSYGGDFEFMSKIAETQDSVSLRKYGLVCIQAIYRLLEGLGERTISIAAVGGTCLGGGLEGAMAHDYLVAERGRKMGLPEANIGMFPGAGAYSMLTRKIGRREAERLITTGAYFTTDEAFEMGIVDRLCDKGEIEKGILALQEEINPRFNTYLTTVRARRHCAPVLMAEMKAIIDDWVDAAMHMEPHHKMLMQHLLAMQEKNAERAAKNAARERKKGGEVVSIAGGETSSAPNPFRKED